MKLLITGATGLYGSKLAQLALSRGIEVYSGDTLQPAPYGTTIKLDITDKTLVDAAFEAAKPDVVIHAAALTDVDKNELNRELAWKVNVEGTTNMANAAKKNGAFLIVISTDYVFDGEKGNYKETDLPSPVSFYGYSKLKAEEAARKILPDCCIARTSVIYGATPAAGKINFALWLLNKLQNKEKINVFTDQYNTPTLNTNLAQMTLEAAERKLTGTYHLCGATRISRYDYATLFAQIFNLDNTLITPTLSKDLKFPAKRPKDSSLDATKAQQTLKNKPLTIQEAFKQLKTEITNQTTP